jgi:hypothetical protein
MKKIFFILCLLSGCASNPVIINFPDPPTELMVKPPELVTIKKTETITEAMLKDTSPSDVTLTTLITITTQNMGICHKYRDQIFGLQDWITSQQSLNK